LVKASLKAPATLATVGADAKDHFAHAAFGQPASHGVEPAAAVDSGVVVTYANNRSSVVITRHQFGLDPAVAGHVPEEHRP
jgi:hypothetical protein